MKHKIDRPWPDYARALGMPKYAAEIYIKLDNIIAKLCMVRPDLDKEDVKRNIIRLSNEYRCGGLRSWSFVMDIIGSDLYKAVCEGDPLPWETDQ